MNYLKTALFSAALCVAASAAHGQTIFSADFEPPTFTAFGSVAGNGGFTTNDPENPGLETPTTQVGGLNQVVPNAILGNQAGQLLGGYSSGGVDGYPGMATVNLSHAFDLTTQPVALAANGFQFDTDFEVNSSLNGLHSAYAFSLQGPSGNLFSVNFTNIDSTTAEVGYTSLLGSTVDSGHGVTLDGVYHLTVHVSPLGLVTASFYGVGTPGNVAPIATNLAVVGIDTANDISVTQSGGTTEFTASHDAITFDNFAVTVPEPSTYVMMGLGLLGLVGMMKFRRRSA